MLLTQFIRDEQQQQQFKKNNINSQYLIPLFKCYGLMRQWKNSNWMVNSKWI